MGAVATRGGPDGQRAGVGDLDTSVAHAFRHGRRRVSLGPGTGRARTAPRALRARHRSPGPPVDRPDDGRRADRVLGRPRVRGLAGRAQGPRRRRGGVHPGRRSQGPHRGGVRRRGSRPRCGGGADHRRSDDPPAPRRRSGRRRTRRRQRACSRRWAGKQARRGTRRPLGPLRPRSSWGRLILLGLIGILVLGFIVTNPRLALMLLTTIASNSGRGGGNWGGGGFGGGGGGWGGGGGGGFSGGGGRSGGGGASGSW